MRNAFQPSNRFFRSVCLKAILLASVVLPESCNLYTRYERPSIAFADSLYMRSVDSLTIDTTSIASLSWRELFSDSLLQYYIATGLANNTDLSIARLKVTEAEATLQASRLAFFPSASFSASAGVNYNAKNSFSVGPSVSWEPDFFGRQRNAKRGAEAALAQSQAYKQHVQTQLVATIADSYYTLLMLDDQRRISQRTLDTWEENIRALQAWKRAGKTNEAAVLQARANKLSVENSVLTLERQIIEQENAFAALLGLVPQAIERGQLLDEPHFPQVMSIGIPLQLVNQRPDVQQAEQALAEAYYATKAARAAFYPNVTLGGSVGWSVTRGGSISNPGSWLLSAVASLVQPLFAKGTNRARLKIAQAQQEEALLAFRQSLLNAGTEVNNSLVRWQTARKRRDIDKKQILNLRAAVWNTVLLMKHAPSTNYLEVLTAQQQLLQAELTETSDKYDEIQGIISLYRALGGGTE